MKHTILGFASPFHQNMKNGSDSCYSFFSEDGQLPYLMSIVGIFSIIQTILLNFLAIGSFHQSSSSCFPVCYLTEFA